MLNCGGQVSPLPEDPIMVKMYIASGGPSQFVENHCEWNTLLAAAKAISNSFILREAGIDDDVI